MSLRTVIEEPRFTQDIDGFRRKYPRIDEVHLAITWILARTPFAGTPLEVAPDFRVFETTAVGDTPAFWVLYTFDHEKVYLHSIEPVKGSLGEDE
jgi:hypothetical protein